jgi:hypothetical protein
MYIQAFSVHIPRLAYYILGETLHFSSSFIVNGLEISTLYLGTENECKFKLFLSISQKLDSIFWDRCIILIKAVPVHIQEISLLYTGTDNECKFKHFLSISQKLTNYYLGQTLHFSSSFFCQYPRN